MWTVPDLCDAYEGGVTVLEPVFRSFGGNPRFSGTAVTVKCFEDNSQVKALAEQPGLGRVMVVDGGGSLRASLLGDQVAQAACVNGWSGIVIYGCVRDVDALAQLALGIQALAAYPRRTIKRGFGDVDVPVTFAGATLYPGDFIAADLNGILVAPEPLALPEA